MAGFDTSLTFSRGLMGVNALQPTPPTPAKPDFSLGTPQLSSTFNPNAPTPPAPNSPPTNQGAGNMPWGGSDAKIFGMPVANFTSLLGGIGSAFAEPGSFGDRLGKLAQGIGNMQLSAAATQEAAKQQQANLKALLSNGGDINKLTPEQAKMLGIELDFSNASGNTGLESGNQTPSKLDKMGSYFGNGSWFTGGK